MCPIFSLHQDKLSFSFQYKILRKWTSHTHLSLGLSPQQTLSTTSWGWSGLIFSAILLHSLPFWENWVLMFQQLITQFSLFYFLLKRHLCKCSIKLHAFSHVLELKLRREFQTFLVMLDTQMVKMNTPQKRKWGSKPHLGGETMH